MLGVFHYRSKKGQYKLNYTAAEQACAAEGGRLATYTQLAYAQQVSEHITVAPRQLTSAPGTPAETCQLCVALQGGLNMCAAGWLDQARVAYPTTYSNPKCGFGHVGIVDYGTRKNLSETWDTFCYRMQGEGGR